MNSVERYIAELIEQHDCVVIPEFGGFVLSQVSSRFSMQGHELRPPSKDISFNRNLQHNDGLLAHHIVRRENISYAEACHTIQDTILRWKEKLAVDRTLSLAEIGVFSAGAEKNWQFEPDNRQNFLRSSFGLGALQMLPIEQQQGTLLNKEFSKGLPSFAPSTGLRRKARKWLVSSAAAAVLLAAGSVWFSNAGLFHSTVSQIPGKATSVKQTANSISRILNEAPGTTEEQKADLQYYIIGGSFSTQDRANRFVKELAEKGFKAELLNNENGYYRVAYQKEKDSVSADNYLRKIKLEENQAAWLLKW